MVLHANATQRTFLRVDMAVVDGVRAASFKERPEAVVLAQAYIRAGSDAQISPATQARIGSGKAAKRGNFEQLARGWLRALCVRGARNKCSANGHQGGPIECDVSKTQSFSL